MHGRLLSCGYILAPAIKSRYTSSKEVVKASTTSKCILPCQLLKSVATLLKVLIAQELIIQRNFLLPRKPHL